MAVHSSNICSDFYDCPLKKVFVVSIQSLMWREKQIQKHDESVEKYFQLDKNGNTANKQVI